MRIRVLYIALIFSLFASKMQAAGVGNNPAGTDFWVASTYPFYSGDTFFVAVSSTKPTRAYLEIPGFGILDSVDLGFNEIKYFLIPKAVRQGYYYYYPTAVNKVGNNGIHVFSKLPVKVYSFSTGAYYSSGATAVYPSASQPPNGVYYPYKSRYSFSTGGFKYRIYFFTVVAIDDSTVVKMDVLNAGTTLINNRPQGDSVLLKRGQTARFYMWSFNQNDEPRMAIKATGGKRISVFTENFYDMEDGAACFQFDLMYEQMMPENLLGKAFILTPIYFLKKGYKFSVSAVQDSTKIYRNGVFEKMINEAEIYYSQVGKDSSIEITTDKPVTCWQKIALDTCTSGYYWNNGGISLFTVNANEQAVTDANVMIPTTDDYPSNFMNIIVPKIGKDSLYVDGGLIAVGDMKPILNGNYYLYSDSMPKGNIRVLNKYGFYAYAYGRGTYGGYAYNASSGLKSLKRVLYATSYKSCDSGYLVDVWSEGVPAENFKWSLNGIFLDTGFRTLLYVPKAGIYTLGLNYDRIGQSGQDSVFIEIKVQASEPYNFIAARTQKICKNEYKVQLPYSKVLDYTWGDGSKSRERVFTSTGINYLSVLNTELNCTIKDTIDVAFFDTIKAEINFVQSSQCPGIPIYLSSVSKKGAGDSIVNYQWYVDGQKTGSYSKDTIPYSYPGIYKFKLHITNLAGCVDSAETETYVSAIPKLVVGTISIDSCAGTSNIRFNSRSSLVEGKIAGYKWMFSDGDTGDISYGWKQTIRNFKKAGMQGYRFSAYTEQGCADTTPWKYVRIYGGPVPYFSITDSSVCKNGNYFTIQNNTPQKDSAKLFVWLWGDGSGTTLTDPSFISYADTGTYRIQMAGVDPSNLCGGDTAVRIVRVLESPKAKITTDSSNFCFNNNYYALNDASDSKGAEFKRTVWKWSANKSDTTYTGKGLIKFSAIGNFNITMYHSTGKGCIDSAKKNLVVFASPTASFIVSDSVFCAPKTTFSVTNTSTTIGASTYKWQSPNWSYTTKDIGPQSITNNGLNKIQLIVNDQLYGCKDTAEKYLQVHPKLNLGILPSDTQTCFPGTTFVFSDTSSVSLDSLSKKYWQIGSDTFMSFPISYTPIAKGTQLIKLIYNVAGVCKDTVSQAFLVKHAKDSVKISGGENALCIPALVPMQANTFAGENWNYTWYYLNSAVQAASSHNILFANSGVKQVKVIASIGACTMSDSVSINLLEKPDLSIISNTDISQCINTQNFDLSTQVNYVTNPVQYTWQVAKNLGNTSQLKPIFNAAGNYTATVMINDYNNCKDTAQIQLIVLEKPTLVLSDVSACVDDIKQVPYTINPAGYALTQYQWFVNNIASSTSSQYNHTFNNTTPQPVYLIAQGTNGCIDTSNIATLLGIDKPIASFLATMQNSTSAGVPVKFTNTSSNYSKSIWNLEPNVTDTTQNPRFLYTNLGNKNIVLTVYNTQGCWDSAHLKLFVTSDALGFIPTAFSPNADGKNETFKPAELSAVNEYQMSIFNRWGQRIFATNDPAEGWNGTYNGQPVPEGAYMVSIYARFITGAGFLHNGTVTVIR